MKKHCYKQKKILLIIALGLLINSMNLFAQCNTNSFAASNYNTSNCGNHFYQGSLGSLSNVYGSCGNLRFSSPLTGGDLVIKNEEFSDNIFYNIYPNPNMGTIFLEGGKLNEEVSASIYTLTGQRLFTVKQYMNSSMDLGDILPGFYVLQIKNSKNQLYTFKIIKL